MDKDQRRSGKSQGSNIPFQGHVPLIPHHLRNLLKMPAITSQSRWSFGRLQTQATLSINNIYEANLHINLITSEKEGMVSNKMSKFMNRKWVCCWSIETTSRAWGHGLVSKVFATGEQRFEFDAQHPHVKPGRAVHAYNPSAGMEDKRGP